VQYQPGSGGTHGAPDGNGAAVYIHPLRTEPPLWNEAEMLFAPFGTAQCSEACQYLCSEGFIQFPKINVGQRQAAPTQQLSGSMDGAQPHGGRVKRGPLGVDKFTQGAELPALDGLPRCQHEQGCAI